jgi:nuclear pore complex protein Nup107
MNSPPLLSELIVIRHETASAPIHPEANTNYWKFTKYSVIRSMRMGDAHLDGLVKEMDPDAPNREEGRFFAADDAVRLVELQWGE